MSDQTPDEAGMSESVESSHARVRTPESPRAPVIHWGRQLWAANPFYPISAALVLYGCYRLSTDAALLKGETPQMIFSFSSLQVYELLLVVTAVFLAARRIFYDSNLLVALESLMVLAPFVLISQAA